MAEITIQTKANFSDLDLNFTAHPVKKDITKYLNEYAILNSIKNLVLTNHYERPFQPDIGSNIRRLLFENIDTLVAAQLEKEVEDTITNFEPRVQIKKVTAKASPDEHRYNLTLEFYLINNHNLVTLNFFLERLR
jgi:phage baseplate assembly protein W